MGISPWFRARHATTDVSGIKNVPRTVFPLLYFHIPTFLALVTIRHQYRDRHSMMVTLNAAQLNSDSQRVTPRGCWRRRWFQSHFYFIARTARLRHVSMLAYCGAFFTVFQRCVIVHDGVLTVRWKLWISAGSRDIQPATRFICIVMRVFNHFNSLESLLAQCHLILVD